MRLLAAKWVPPVIGVLADLGIADHLTAGPLPAGTLASRVGAHPGALYRLLRAAVSVGVFTADDQGRFGLNPVGECLRSDAPGSLRPAAMMFGLEPFWVPYARIRHSVMTGEPAFDQVYGTSVYQYLSGHPDQASLFGAAAAGFHAQAIAQIADAHDFSFYARDTFAPGLADRVDLVAGDFFESVPSGDALVVKSCLHNFADDQATAMLRVIRRAMSDRATLLVAETMIPAGNGPHYAKLDDVEMLVIAGGADRDEQQYARLLAAGGFTVQHVIPCGDRFSLIQAQPA
jgi:hypothetical protein